MTFDYRKYEIKRDSVLKDPRNYMDKFKDDLRNPQTGATMFGLSALAVYFDPFSVIGDLLIFYNSFYFIWLVFLSRKYVLPFKMPKTANKNDPHNKTPGTNKARLADGILYIGNEEKTNEEIWFTNNDARTHILYLGTTGSGKTEGLKAMASNALGWGSGFIYIDGKADTDLWGSISGLARRFGRDDDLLVLNYMSGADGKSASNTVNPFASGSSSYITNLLVSLMPDSGGDNAMWKDRAVALIAALMPVLTWRRNHQEKVLNIATIRDSMRLEEVVKLSRASEIPERLRKSLKGYLYELPGYTDPTYNDDGTEKPPQGGPPPDYSTTRQQHSYLTMQFTRQLQSLSEDYGYIFETPAADIDMMDVVLNRRILVVLIPALEKSADETANLGKIVGSMLKGMMGATLGSSVEGDTDMALENKPTRSTTPFMAVFDEVGYYTTAGMAVMAAQARSLGFCLIFAGQDLPALEKRIKEEARSITANCNLKIFGKLEDPTQTKEFFEKTVGETTVIESATRKEVKVMFGQKRLDHNESFNVTSRAKASYDQLKSFKEGQSIVAFGDRVVQVRMFYSNPNKIKSLRINKFISMPHPDPDGKRAGKEVDAILERIRDKKWTAEKALSKTEAQPVVDMLAKYFDSARQNKRSVNEAGCFAVTQTAFETGLLSEKDTKPKAIEAAKPVAVPQPAALAAPTKEDEALKFSAVPPAIDATHSFAELGKATEPVPLQTAKASASLSEKPYPSEEKNPADAKEETLNWAQLVGGAEDSKAEKLPAVKPAATQAKLEATPAVAESISWKDLVDNDKAGSGPKPKPVPIPAGGFGMGGFGTGFGGIGGISFSAGSTPPVANQPPQDKVPDPDPTSGEGETVNWKDLLK